MESRSAPCLFWEAMRIELQSRRNSVRGKESGDKIAAELHNKELGDRIAAELHNKTFVLQLEHNYFGTCRGPSSRSALNFPRHAFILFRELAPLPPPPSAAFTFGNNYDHPCS